VPRQDGFKRKKKKVSSASAAAAAGADCAAADERKPSRGMQLPGAARLAVYKDLGCGTFKASAEMIARPWGDEEAPPTPQASVKVKRAPDGGGGFKR
jgi:hypothetical protein